MAKKQEEREIERWITVSGGRRIPIFKGDTRADINKRITSGLPYKGDKAKATSKKESASTSKKEPTKTKKKESLQEKDRYEEKSKEMYGKSYDELPVGQRRAVRGTPDSKGELKRLESVKRKTNKSWQDKDADEKERQIARATKASDERNKEHEPHETPKEFSKRMKEASKSGKYLSKKEIQKHSDEAWDENAPVGTKVSIEDESFGKLQKLEFTKIDDESYSLKIDGKKEGEYSVTEFEDMIGGFQEDGTLLRKFEVIKPSGKSKKDSVKKESSKPDPTSTVVPSKANIKFVEKRLHGYTSYEKGPKLSEEEIHSIAKILEVIDNTDFKKELKVGEVIKIPGIPGKFKLEYRPNDKKFPYGFVYNGTMHFGAGTTVEKAVKEGLPYLRDEIVWQKYIKKINSI